MAAYLAMRIEQGRLNYYTVVNHALYGQFKEDIDIILASDGYIVNADGTVTKQ